MSTKYTKLVFDFDGTLVNTMPDLENLAVRLITNGRPGFSETSIRSTYRHTSGDPFETQLPRILHCLDYDFLSDDQQREITEEFARQKVAITLGARPFPDVEGTIRRLSLDHRVYVVSSTLTGLVEDWLYWQSFSDGVTEVLGIDQGTKTSNLARFAPGTLFVGDSRRDAEHARAAGVDFAFLDRGLNLIALDPDIPRLTTLYDLPALLTEVRGACGEAGCVEQRPHAHTLSKEDT